ncbi:phage terminase large subunit family protein [Neobacillus mesonae]|uniref:phage terminase large subunit family protein n=1 Tax=Neobacillus mesonae TaxID=1193713 RepID=UPI00203D3E9A|nr:phage terminase large subunit family protein [Neobacillus mesonae]MCM3567862.1 phage terminase large subunit family protein [Neobacillus mesonae]
MVHEKTVRLFKSLAKLWEPNPDLTVSEWADRYRVLTSETSAEPGPWRTERAPYMRAIMDSVADKETEEVAIMASAQVGKTEFMLNMVGFHIDYDPCPIMFMLPNKNLIDYFSKKRLSTMIDVSPTLRSKVSEAKSRDSGNTIDEKSFPGGYIAIVGANAPASLSSRPIRIVLCDEVDRYPVSAGTEGDPISLALKRTTTFRHNRKHVFVSTPLIKETSRIEQLYNDSTMEEWCLPCPNCGEMQPIKWEKIKFAYEKSDSGQFQIKKVGHRCSSCGFLYPEKEWKKGKGQWVAQKEHSSRRGFHLNQLVSPWSSWEEIVQSFLIAKHEGREKLKVWTNTVLGQSWEEEGEQMDEEELFNRREGYPAPVPDGVKILTAAVDTQDDRFEIEIVGWGAGKESWGIEYHQLYGDLRQPKIWRELDEYLSRTWSKQDGSLYGIACTCIDSGGHFTQEVYRFTAPRESRRIYAIKGQGAQNNEYVPLINGYSRTKREKALLISLGVSEGKAKVMSSLKIREIGPGFCHFPLEYNQKYFEGLTAEKIQTKYSQGVAYRVWKKIRDRNEPLDLRVYNTAALEILNPNLDKEYSSSTNKRRKKRRPGVVSKGVR